MRRTGPGLSLVVRLPVDPGSLNEWLWSIARPLDATAEIVLVTESRSGVDRLAVRRLAELAVLGLPLG